MQNHLSLTPAPGSLGSVYTWSVACSSSALVWEITTDPLMSLALYVKACGSLKKMELSNRIAKKNRNQKHPDVEYQNESGA